MPFISYVTNAKGKRQYIRPEGARNAANRAATFANVVDLYQDERVKRFRAMGLQVSIIGLPAKIERVPVYTRTGFVCGTRAVSALANGCYTVACAYCGPTYYTARYNTRDAANAACVASSDQPCRKCGGR